MTRHAEVAASKDVCQDPGAGRPRRRHRRPQVRNMGTIGGSLAHNDPAADYPAAVLGLGATINTNKRNIAADEFFKGMFETALQAGEIIASVSFPGTQAGRLHEVQEPRLALCHRRRVRGQDRQAACAWRSPARRRACSGLPRWKKRWPRSGRPRRSPASRCRREISTPTCTPAPSTARTC